MIQAGPTFTTVPPRSSAGDFLSMGAIGERMYGGVFPGLNNAVRHVRPYAAICWMIHKLQKRAFAQGKADIDLLREQTYLGIWKIQLLLNWVAKLDGMQMYPGTDRFADDPDEVVLRRESWSNIKISFWDTAWYKPSLLNGLRFLNEGAGEYRRTYSCTPAGIALAEAYDAAVQALGDKLANWLADPYELTCTKRRLNTLRSVLALGSPSKAEQKAFLRQYFHAEFDQALESGKNRRKGLMLTLRTLAGLQEEDADMTVETIRHAMAAGYTPGGSRIDVKGLEGTQLHWSILQIRALQRLAMETLLGLVERHILLAEQTGTARQKEDIASAIAAYLEPGENNGLLPTVQENCDWLMKAQGEYPTLQAAGLVEGREELSTAALKVALRGSVGSEPDAWPDCARQAIWTLIVCAIDAANLMGAKGAKRLLGWDQGKLSLNELRRTMNAYKSRTTVEFTRYMVGKFVIAQHLAVAVERSVVGLDGKQRFVFTPERDGLTRFADAGAARFMDTLESGDILFHALLLLENCGKLAYATPDEGPAYTNRFNATFTLKKSAYKLLEESV